MNHNTHVFIAIPLFAAGAFLLVSALTGFRFAPQQDIFLRILPIPSSTADYAVSGAACILIGIIILLIRKNKN